MGRKLSFDCRKPDSFSRWEMPALTSDMRCSSSGDCPVPMRPNARSAAAVAWQFAAPDPEKREKVALRVIAVSFFGLAAYVSVDATLSLTGLRDPEHSTVGIVLAALSLLVMPFLSWFERRTGRELGSASAVADSKQTLICTYLSAALLVGLLLNSLLGWAWADSIAALVIAGFAIREGIEAWRGDACCAAPVAVLTGEREPEHCDDTCCKAP